MLGHTIVYSVFIGKKWTTIKNAKNEIQKTTGTIVKRRHPFCRHLSGILPPNTKYVSNNVHGPKECPIQSNIWYFQIYKASQW